MPLRRGSGVCLRGIVGMLALALVHVLSVYLVAGQLPQLQVDAADAVVVALDLVRVHSIHKRIVNHL